MRAANRGGGRQTLHCEQPHNPAQARHNTLTSSHGNVLVPQAHPHRVVFVQQDVIVLVIRINVVKDLEGGGGGHLKVEGLVGKVVHEGRQHILVAIHQEERGSCLLAGLAAPVRPSL